MSEEKSIAAVGSEEFTLGFRLAGVDESHKPEDFDAKISSLLEREDIGIIVTQDSEISKASKKTRRKIETSVDPVVIGLSEEAESERLQEKIKKAIGADIT